MSVVRVPVGGEVPYDVVVGRGVIEGLRELLPAGATRVALVFPAALRDRAGALADELAIGSDVLRLEVPNGEEAKTLAVAGRCWDSLAEAGFTRSDVVVGFGGGAVTDLAGFVAAAWLRGVPVVQVPTTLLGMVDAAVGGKTGINLGSGKNLVGAFHPPAAVLCDLALLETLPRADYVSGLAEVVKAGLIADPRILELVESDPKGAGQSTGPHAAELIERAIRVKAEVVSGDLRERTTSAGERAMTREMLNYGHTLGHAIEKVESYSWRHGDAVSVGLVYAAELAQLAGRLPRAVVDRHRDILRAVGLPVSYSGPWPDLFAAMRVDKKSRGNVLRFIVLDDIGRPRLLEGPDPELLEAAYATLGH